MALNSVIGALRVNLGLNSASFLKGLNKSEKELRAFQRRINNIGQNLQSLGTKLSVGLTLPLVGLATKSVDAAAKQEKAIAAVDAALSSMGQTAGFTSEQLQEIASSLQGNSLFGDEEILTKVTANLLTFGNIADEQFTRAQQLALDLSARLDQDLKSSAIQLGKALNDPVRGISALSEVGVSFTEQQKEQIKAMAEAGNVAEAQTLILAELEKQYRGQAEALSEVDSGRITQSLNRISDATEKIGVIVLPVIASIAEAAADMADSFANLDPKTQKIIVGAAALGATLGPLAVSVGLAVTAFSALLPVIAAIASPIGIAVLAVAGLSAAVVALYKNLDEVVRFFKGVGTILKTAALDAVDAFIEGLRTIIERTREVIGELSAAIKGKVKEIGSDMLQAGKDVAAGLGNGIKAGAKRAREAATNLGQGLIDSARDVLRTRSPSREFKDIGADVVQGLVIGIDDNAGSAVEAAAELGRSVGQAASDGMKQTLENLAVSLKSGGVPGLFEAIRSEGQNAFGNILNGAFGRGGGGIGQVFSDLRGSIAGVGTAIQGVFSGGGLGAVSGLIGAALPVIGAIGAIGSVIKGLIGTKTVIGKGFELGFSDGDLFGGEFTTTRRKALFGLISSTKTNIKDFDSELFEALRGETSAIQTAVSKVYESLGVTVTDSMIDSVSVAVQKFDTRNLNQEQIEEKFSEIFTAYGDALSESIGGIGLNAAAILSQVSAILRPAGQVFFGTLQNMATAAGDVAERFGGVGGLANSVGAFVEGFFSESEKLEILSNSISDVFADLGLAVPKTRDAFKELVLAQNLMTESGREAYAALLNVAPQFQAISQAASSFGAFDFSSKRFDTVLEEQISQIALARDYDLDQVRRLGGNSFDDPESPIGYLDRIADTLDRMETIGIPERG